MTESEKAILGAFSESLGNTGAIVAAVAALLSVAPPTNELRNALTTNFERQYSMLLNMQWPAALDAFELIRDVLESAVASPGN